MEAETQQTETTEAINATEQLTTHWTDNVNEEYRGGLQKFNSVDDLAKSYINLEKFASTKGIPDDNAPQEAKDEFYKRLGRPDDVSGYEITPPEGLQLDEGAFDAVKAKAHELGISKKQFEELAGTFLEGESGKVQQMAQEAEQQQQQQMESFNKEFENLKDKWGENFDANIAMSQKAARAVGWDKETMDRVEGVVGPAALIGLFHKIGGLLTDEQIVEGASVNTNYMSSHEASVKLGEMMNDPKVAEALMNKGHPMHATYNEERLKLTRIKNGVK